MDVKRLALMLIVLLAAGCTAIKVKCEQEVSLMCKEFPTR